MPFELRKSEIDITFEILSKHESVTAGPKIHKIQLKKGNTLLGEYNEIINMQSLTTASAQIPASFEMLDHEERTFSNAELSVLYKYRVPDYPEGTKEEQRQMSIGLGEIIIVNPTK
jgi:hypothetical protein